MTESNDIYKSYQTLLNDQEKIKSDLLSAKKALLDDLVNRFLQEAKKFQISDKEITDKINKVRNPKGQSSSSAESKKFKIVGSKPGVEYANQDNLNETWTGGTKGPKPKWLMSKFKDTMNRSEMTAVFDRLKK